MYETIDRVHHRDVACVQVEHHEAETGIMERARSYVQYVIDMNPMIPAEKCAGIATENLQNALTHERRKLESAIATLEAYREYMRASARAAIGVKKPPVHTRGLKHRAQSRMQNRLPSDDGVGTVAAGHPLVRSRGLGKNNDEPEGAT